MGYRLPRVRSPVTCFSAVLSVPFTSILSRRCVVSCLSAVFVCSSPPRLVTFQHLGSHASTCMLRMGAHSFSLLLVWLAGWFTLFIYCSKRETGTNVCCPRLEPLTPPSRRRIPSRSWLQTLILCPCLRMCLWPSLPSRRPTPSGGSATPLGKREGGGGYLCLVVMFIVSLVIRQITDGIDCCRARHVNVLRVFAGRTGTVIPHNTPPHYGYVWSYPGCDIVKNHVVKTSHCQDATSSTFCTTLLRRSTGKEMREKLTD